MSWLDDHPDIHSVRAVTCELNAQARAKRIPRRDAGKLETDGTRMPFSILNLDIWGEDIEDGPLVFEAGDPDGVLKPTDRGFLPMPWLETPTALLPHWMYHDDGRPFAGDPRHALASVLARYATRGLTPVVATELEFYLIDDSGKTLRQPISPRSGKRRPGAETLAMRQLDAFDGFFTAIYDACEAMDIPADTAISEAGLGQFEINMMHCDDALRAALPTVRRNGDIGAGTPFCRNYRFPGVDADLMLRHLHGHLSASMGSACTAGAIEPSHVLTAMGLTGADATSSLRFGFGRGIDQIAARRAATLVAKAAQRSMTVN